MTGSTVDCPSIETPSNRIIWRWLRGGCAIVLAAVFCMAGITKLTDPQRFLDQLSIRIGMPHHIALPLAAIIPCFELTCGLCLALGYAPREAATLLALLLVVLFGYSLGRLGDSTDCACFVFPQLVDATPWWWPPLRNFLLLLLCVPILLRPPLAASHPPNDLTKSATATDTHSQSADPQTAD